MTELILAAKAGLGVMLVVAGAAKLSDLDDFAATLRLFVHSRTPKSVRRGAAVVIAGTELTLGIASVSSPTYIWLNVVVVFVTSGFLVVSIYGFVFHRGRSCMCFGALSGRKFDAVGILRSAAIAGAAFVALASVPHSALALASAARVLLLVASLLLAVVSFTAARSLALSRASNRRRTT